MSNYTKGPWTWDEPSNWHGLDARVFVPEPYAVLAQVPIEALRPRSIGRANAKLIACAPEMAEMLLSMFVHISHGGPTREEAEALLKKAGIIE